MQWLNQDQKSDTGFVVLVCITNNNYLKPEAPMSERSAGRYSLGRNRIIGPKHTLAKSSREIDVTATVDHKYSANVLHTLLTSTIPWSQPYEYALIQYLVPVQIYTNHTRALSSPIPQPDDYHVLQIHHPTYTLTCKIPKQKYPIYQIRIQTNTPPYKYPTI